MVKKEDVRIVRTACPAHCGIDACGILAHVHGDRVVKLEPADFPDPGYRRICLRGLSSLDITYHPDRLKYPMKRVGQRGEGKFERISWDEALGTVATRFREIASEHGESSIGWVLGGPGSGTTKFGAYLRLASLTQGTRVSTWGYGDAGLPCGTRVVFGTHFPYELLAGWSDPNLIIVWGSNPGESVPLNQMRRIMDAKERGARLVVIDPRFTVTASKADEYLGIRPGTDAALALGMIHVVLERGLQDEAFLRLHTVAPYLVRTDTGALVRGRDVGLVEGSDCVVWDEQGQGLKPAKAQEVTAALTGRYRVNGLELKPSFQLLQELAEAYPPETASGITGIPEQLIIRLAEEMINARPVSIVTHMGLSRTYHGDLSIRAVAALSSITGNVSLSSRSGHRPVVLNWQPFLHADPSGPTSKRLGVLQMYDAITSGKPFPIKAVWMAFINFLNQCANSNRIRNEIFPNLEFIAVADLFMTPTARYADILMPACSFLEFSDLIMGPHPYLQLQRKVVEPLYESRSDVDIASGLARKMGLGSYFDFGEEGFINLLLDSGHPSVEGIDVERLKQGPAQTHASQVPDRDDEVRFSTPSGKIELYAERLHPFGQALSVYLEPLEGPSFNEKYPLTFVQGHSRFRTHSMFANAPRMLEMNPEPVVEINPLDARARNIDNDEWVTVFNDRGRATLKARLTEGVRPGVVNICEGWWVDQFREGDVNALTHDAINPVQEKVFEPNMAMNDVAVDVRKA
ncbi:MAG: molybdopterin-dependent oxidoreductase [Deltaproteobacteria bacterium]|nr:molybdopterin-dependent oxidoreductase [Deltaproteobacteria bacterium]